MTATEQAALNSTTTVDAMLRRAWTLPATDPERYSLQEEAWRLQAEAWATYERERKAAERERQQQMVVSCGLQAGDAVQRATGKRQVGTVERVWYGPSDGKVHAMVVWHNAAHRLNGNREMRSHVQVASLRKVAA